MSKAGKYLLVIGGPTASGKTRLAIQAAQLSGAEIVSADSRQLYRELHIGVARPSAEELSAIPHHFIASHSIHLPLNAGSYAHEARQCIDKLFLKNRMVVVLGGTGMYIKALLEGFDPLPAADEVLRKELNDLYHREGIAVLQEKFRQVTGESSPNVEMDNPHRLIRAIEIAAQTNDGLPGNAIPDFKTDFTTVKWGIEVERDLLYDRINERVDRMVAEGLEDEARALFPQRHLNPLRTVGYTEWFDHFEGSLTRDEAIEKIKQHSRNYAKRQYTWFRKDPHFEWLPGGISESDLIQRLNQVTG